MNSIVPNPGTGVEKVTYSIPAAATIRLEIFNQLGQRVRSFTYPSEEAGVHEHEFDISDMPSGSYILRVQLGSTFETVKIELIK